MSNLKPTSCPKREKHEENGIVVLQHTEDSEIGVFRPIDLLRVCQERCDQAEICDKVQKELVTALLINEIYF